MSDFAELKLLRDWANERREIHNFAGLEDIWKQADRDYKDITKIMTVIARSSTEYFKDKYHYCLKNEKDK